MSLLEVKNLSKQYHRKSRQVEALQSLSFSVEKGEVLGIVGESGSGKSTILRLLAGLEKPSTGEIYLEGAPVVQRGSRHSKERCRQMQMVFQDASSAFDPRKKLRFSLEEPLRYLAPELSSAERWQKIQNLLEQVELLEEWTKKYPSELSGGQCQRMAIVRALSVEPALLLCDEITSALDIEVQEELIQLLSQLQQERQLTILWVTHDLLQAERLCGRILVMQQGKCAEEGENVLQNPKSQYTIRLLKAARLEGLAADRKG